MRVLIPSIRPFIPSHRTVLLVSTPPRHVRPTGWGRDYGSVAINEDVAVLNRAGNPGHSTGPPRCD